MLSEPHAMAVIMLELQVKTKQSPPQVSVFHASFSISLKQNSNIKKKCVFMEYRTGTTERCQN